MCQRDIRKKPQNGFTSLLNVEIFIMLYIKDIHDDYISEIQRQKELEYYCNYDTLTGIGNRFYYNNFCNKYNSREEKLPIGIIFSDLNGLKYVNDNFGHKQGDEYIKKFSDMLVREFGSEVCCRISGDEFIVFIEGEIENIFIERAESFHQKLQDMEEPIASMGYVWENNPQNVETPIKEAETAMYMDKHEFYARHPERARS